MSDPTRRLAPVVRLAPAKVNLTLAVLGRRPDGFHALHSVVVPLGLSDRLSVAVRPSGDDSLHVAGGDPAAPGENLVLRAIRATRAAARAAVPPGALPPLAARLDKRIPVAAGLGGGSSDAAAAIDAALEAWDVDLPAESRQAIAAGLGSDVPFFLAGRPAVIEGRGETVSPLPRPVGEPPGVLLVTPATPVATADVFALFAAAGGTGSGSTRLASAHLAQELLGGLRSGDLIVRAGVLASANDLVRATATLFPQLVPFRRALMRRLGRPIGQSGSGPTLWALYPSREAAEAAATDLRSSVEAGEAGELTAGGRPPSIIATELAPGTGREP